MKVTLLVSFFVWMVARVKILSSINLRKMGFLIVDWCCKCRCSGETMDHPCQGAHQLWNFAFRSFRVSWVLLERVLDLLTGWRN